MMEGLLRLINHTAGSSVRAFVRWTDMLLLNPRGWELERALVPLGQHSSLSFPLTELEDFDDMEDKKSEGFLWGVPKKRKSAMKRLRRKFGHEDWGSPLLKPKSNLRICDTCGHHYEAKHLCGNCYARVKAETKLIRENIEAKFGHSAEDKSIIVMYEAEKEALGKESSDNWKDNIIIEIPKQRPPWFSSNLLQKSLAGVNTEVKAVTPQAPTPTIAPSKSSDSNS